MKQNMYVVILREWVELMRRSNLDWETLRVPIPAPLLDDIVKVLADFDDRLLTIEAAIRDQAENAK